MRNVFVSAFKPLTFTYVMTIIVLCMSVYVVELEGKISNSVLPLKTRLLERMQVRTEFKPPAAYQTQVPVQVQQAPPVQVNQTLTQPQSNHQYQLQLQPHKQRFPAATQPYVSYQPQYNGITKDNIGHSSYPAIIQLADVENSAKILINEVCSIILAIDHCHVYILTHIHTYIVTTQSNASSSDYTSESTSSDKDSNVDNPQGKVDKDFCPQIIPPSSLQSHQRVATHSGPPPPASVTVARPKGGVVKAAPAINSATTTACNGMAKALGQSNLSAHGTSKTSGPQESGIASSLHSTVPAKPNPTTTTAAAAVNKSVPTGMVRQTNKASDSSTANSTVNGTSKAALPLSTSSKNVSGVVPPVQVSAVTKCSPLTAKLYGNYANLFAATAAPSTATSTSISTVSKDPSSTQSHQTKKSVGIAVKQPPLAAAAVAVAVIKPPPATESIPPIHPNNPPNSLKKSSTSISNSSIINANANATKSSASVPPDRDEDTYNKLFQLWASAADDPMSKQQQSGGPRQPERVSSGDGQATNSRSRANSVDLFFSDDDDYSTFDSLEYDKISEDVLRNNAMKNTLQGSQTSIIGQYGIAEAPVVQNTSFCKPPPVNVYSSISNSAVISSSSFANCHNGGQAANYSNEITHEDVINGLQQKPGCLPKRPSFNKNVFDDGCGDNLEVNCFGEAVLISDIPIMEASMPIHPYNAVSMENYNSFKPSGLANLSNFVMYRGARTSSFPGSSVNTTSSPSNKRQIAEISNAGATMYGNKAPNSLNRGVDAKKSVSSSASSAASSSRNTATTSATANTASTANNGTAASGGGNHNAYRNGGVESTSSTISSTTSSISLDPLRRQQVCIKSEIMSLLQPTKESNATAPTGSATPKGDNPMTLQASASNAKRSPTTTSDESEVQFYKSSVDIDTSNAMALGGFDNGLTESKSTASPCPLPLPSHDDTIPGSAKETNGDEFMSSRRRKRLHQIVPNPRKPRQADYTCFVCSEAYRCNVSDNPW